MGAVGDFLGRRNLMKKAFAILTVLFIFSSTFAFAGGDQNMNRHDGEKGQGSTTQERNRLSK